MYHIERDKMNVSDLTEGDRIVRDDGKEFTIAKIYSDQVRIKFSDIPEKPRTHKSDLQGVLEQENTTVVKDE